MSCAVPWRSRSTSLIHRGNSIWSSRPSRNARDGEDPGYQINADALRWLPAHGEIRPLDRTRLLDAGEIPPDVNRYFVSAISAL